MTPAERVTRITQEAVGSDLSSWERHQFLPSVRNQSNLSAKQETIMRQIEKKLGLSGDEDE